VVLRCVDLAGVVELDGAGLPVAFRRPCRNRACCPRREGFVPVHRWPLVGDGMGDYETRYERVRSAADLAAGTHRG